MNEKRMNIDTDREKQTQRNRETCMHRDRDTEKQENRAN